MIEKTMPRILVLDDEAFMLKLITRILENLGFTQVTGCGSGRVALEWVDSPDSAPEIILCDLNMPEMDGIEFLRKLVDHGYTGSLILVSGESERILQVAEKLVRVHRIPLLGYLQKPVAPAALAALLAKWSPASQGIRPEADKAYDANAVRAALANGELVNYYQPQVSVDTGRVIGVETLVRWPRSSCGRMRGWRCGYPSTYRWTI